MDFTVKMADKVIRIKNIYTDLKEFCKDYIVENEMPDFSITLTQDDIMYEQNNTAEQGFSFPYLETIATLRKIADVLPNFQRLLVHGAAISYNNQAYLFTAPSGTGKSTHIRLWKKYLGEEVKIVNGDKPFIHIDKNKSVIYGTPWAGKERWQRNCCAPLNGICFLQRGTVNSIRRMEPEECLPLLLNQVYIPDDSLVAGLTLDLIDQLIKTVPLYLLHCDMSENAVRCSFEVMTGLTYPKKI